LALGFYAQFESGLPAYAITVLGVPARTIGTASAVNCLVIVVLQMAVVKWTAKRSGPSLPVAVGSIWVLSWLLLASASVVPVLAGTMFIMVFGVFAVGETMYAPVLNPLTASLAPSGMVSTTLGIFAALQTGVSAAGPMLAGFALNAGHGSLFVGVPRGHQPRRRIRGAAPALVAGRRARARRPAGRQTQGRHTVKRSRNWSSRPRQATCAHHNPHNRSGRRTIKIASAVLRVTRSSCPGR